MTENGFVPLMKEQKKYKKKLIIKNEDTTLKARAARLIKVRNMANLSCKQMCDDGTINVNTYHSWETGLYYGLPVDGAERVAKRVAKEGVSCTTDWLLYGMGTPAYVVANFNPSSKTPNLEDENAFIFDEIAVFKKHFPETIECQIIDDGLVPYFSKGDIVAGVKYYGDAINNLFNKFCIIHLANENIVVRLLKSGTAANKFTLLCINPETSASEPTMRNVEILSAAPILRHYRKMISH